MNLAARTLQLLSKFEQMYKTELDCWNLIHFCSGSETFQFNMQHEPVITGGVVDCINSVV